MGSTKKAVTTKKKAKGKAESGAHGATRARQAGKAGNKATAAKTAKSAANGRKEAVIQLIGREGGATLQQIMDATGWQAHSVRGFISTLGSKDGLKINSVKNDAGERVYSLAA